MKSDGKPNPSMTKSRHIVIDARIRPSSTGRYADRLLEYLQKIDNKNRYTIMLEPNDNWQPVANNFKVVVCPYKKFSFNFLDQINFARFIDKLTPDLVHFAMTPQEPIFYRGRRVTTTHDLTMLRFARAGRLPRALHWVRMAGYRFLFWHSHKASSRIVVPTNFVKSDLISHHPFTKNKITVTLESSEPPLKVEPSPLIGLEAPFIMHVGSPFPHKNIDRLIDAFEMIKNNHPKLKLVLAGKIEHYFNELINEKISTSKYKQDIITPGFIEDSELKWLYENAACYALPSLSEGFGLPGLEAMAHGCPVVSSNATCLPEVYDDGAHYFNPKDVTDMAKKITEVIDDKKLRAKLVRKGRLQLKKYSWQKMAQETLAVYNQVLELDT